MLPLWASGLIGVTCAATTATTAAPTAAHAAVRAAVHSDRSESEAGSSARLKKGQVEALPTYEEAVIEIAGFPDRLASPKEVWRAQQAVRAYVDGTVSEFKVDIV